MTTKKKGRGRPRKQKSLSASVTTSSTAKFFDIKTGTIAKTQPQDDPPVKEPIAKNVPYKDFSILIDNETVNSDIRFIEEGDTHVRDLFLADFYLRDSKFRDFINGVVVMAAREKANRINSELQSLV